MAQPPPARTRISVERELGAASVGDPPQRVEQRRDREVLEDVSLQPPARLLDNLDAVDESRGLAAVRRGMQLVEPVDVEGLRLGAAGHRDQVAEPELDQLQAEVERQRVGAAARAPPLGLELLHRCATAARRLVLEQPLRLRPYALFGLRPGRAGPREK